MKVEAESPHAASESRNAWGHQKLEETRIVGSLELSKEAWPC